MKLMFDLNGAQMAQLAQAVVAEYQMKGLVMVAPERVEPYHIKEAAAALTVGESTIHRWVEAGFLKRVPGTSKVLIVAADVRRMQKGEAV